MDGVEVLQSDTAVRWYKVIGRVLYYVTLPIVKVLLFLIYTIIYILRVILSPFLYTGSKVIQLCLIPYNIAAKFEAVWYFIGVAILIGLVSALVLHGILRTSILVFKLDRASVPKPKDTPPTGHDVKSYRKAQEKKREQAENEQAELNARARALAESPLLKDALKQMTRESAEEYTSPSGRLRGRKSLLDQTIVEHSDEEDS